MKFKALIAGVAGSFAISTVAMAADPIFIPPPAPPPPMAVAPAGFGWGGIYAGASIAVAGGVGIGGQVGFNFVRGSFLLGAEAYIVAGGGDVLVAGLGKAGFLLGPTSRIQLYAAGGVIAELVGGSGVALLVGGGGAIGLGQRLSLFADALVVPGSGVLYRGGLNVHFGN